MNHLIVVLSFLAMTACTTAAEQAPMTGSGAEFTETSSSASSIASVATAPIVIAERLQSGGILEIGNANAPVSMVLFINHSSGYSQQFMQTLVPRLMNDFVSKGILEIGIVPVAFKKYPQSESSAAMMLCATMQGKGRAMNDLLFSQVNAKTLQKQIGAIGLDLPKMQDCLKSDQMKQLLNAETALAQSFNITLVPSYTINSATFTGLPEYADLRGQVEAATK